MGPPRNATDKAVAMFELDLCSQGLRAYNLKPQSVGHEVSSVVCKLWRLQ